MLSHPFKKDNGLYLFGIKTIKIADTPENRQKASKYLGIFFISLSTIFLLLCFIMLILISDP